MDNTKKVIAGGVAAVTAAGLLFIGQWEGKRNEPYRDIGGVWTVCYGSTGAHVLPGGTRSNDECLSLLAEDASRFEAVVNRCTPAPKNQNQFNALTSLSFNIGERAYCNSTLARKFNAGDTTGAANEFPRWSYVGGRYVQGLNNRRQAEKKLFLTPVVAATEVTAPVPVAPAKPACDCNDNGGS